MYLLQSFINQYEVRDKHFEHQLKAKDLECQLAEAKLRQAEELSNKAIERADLYRCRPPHHLLPAEQCIGLGGLACVCVRVAGCMFAFAY